MKYLIKGNMSGYICHDCKENIFPATVILYSPWQTDNVLEHATASDKDTFRIVTDNEKKARDSFFIAEAETDQSGNFEIWVDEQYTRSAFDIDLSCGAVPFKPEPRTRNKPVQIHITTFYPRWISEDNANYYSITFDYLVPAKWWCYIRGHFFDAWTICGHLRSCETKIPIRNANVRAFDADLIRDDYLGSSTTDNNGHFRIDYTSAQFKVNFIPLNLETDPNFVLSSSGPDVYFKADLGSINLINETKHDARANVGYCLCVDLCSKINIVDPDGPIDFPSAWTKIGIFNASYNPTAFDADGHAGGSSKFVLYRTVSLKGQAPHRSAAGNPIEYRFLISDVTTPNNAAAPALSNFNRVIGVGSAANLFVPSIVASLQRKAFPNDDFDVYNDVSDFDDEGWFDINKSIERTLLTHGLGDLNDFLLIDEDTLMQLNTRNLKTIQEINLSSISAGMDYPDSNKIPIEKVAIRFEAREVIDKASNQFNVVPGSGKTLNAVIFNNNDPFMKFTMTELENLGSCSPVDGNVHVNYTIYHPHLQNVNIYVRNNSGSVSRPVTTLLTSNNNDMLNEAYGADLQLNQVPNNFVRCTYETTLNVQTRQHDGGSQDVMRHIPILFFYNG